MKKILFPMATALMLMLAFTSCSSDDSNDDNNNGSEQFSFSEQTYSTWSKVDFAYGSMYDGNETVNVTKEAVTFHSDTWGDGSFTVSSFTRNDNGSYSIAAEGTLAMNGHGTVKSYDATVTGTIAADAQTFVISVPSVMGGTVLNVTVGELPVAAAVEGTYKGGTYVSAAYFQKQYATENEKAVLKANEALDALSVSYTSETWGEFSYENVVATQNEDGSYTLAGEGKCLMPGMGGGAAKEYVATFEGKVSNKTLVATFSVPSVMGGTTVYFNAEDFEEVLADAQENDGK